MCCSRGMGYNTRMRLDLASSVGMQSQRVTTKKGSPRLDRGSPCLGRTSPRPWQREPHTRRMEPLHGRMEPQFIFPAFFHTCAQCEVCSKGLHLSVAHSFIINVNLRCKQGCKILSARVLHPGHRSKPFQRVLCLSDGWCCVSHTELVVSWSTTCFYLF